MNVKVWCAVAAVLFISHSTEGRWVEDTISTDAVSKMRLIFWAEIAVQVLRAERERERERERENALLHNVGILVLIFSSSLLWSFLCSRGPSLFVVEPMQIIFFCPAFSVSVFVAYVRRLQLHPEIWHWCNALRRLVCTAVFKCSGFFYFIF